MKHIFITLLAVVAAVSTSTAQRSMVDLFLSPEADAVFPYIDRAARMDMRDYRDAGQNTATHDGHYNSPVYVENYDNTSIRLKYESAYVDMTLVTAGRDSLIVVTETMPLGAGESVVRIYDTDWKVKPTAYSEPTYSDWLTINPVGRPDIMAQVPFVTAIATVDPELGTISLTNTAINQAGLDPDIKDLFHPNLKFELKKGKFVPVKQKK